ncbi:MAG: cation transporter [Pseudomonadales bacterium]
MKKLFLSLTAVVLIGLGAAAALNSTTIWADAPEAVASERVTEAQTRVFAIENMTCAACPFTVKKAMTRVEGVKEVSINFDAKTATAIFDPAIVRVEDIAAASTNVGYPASLIEGE